LEPAVPLYPFACDKCQTQFDVLCPMTQTPQGKCPSCGKRGRRVFTVPLVSTDKTFAARMGRYEKTAWGGSGQLRAPYTKHVRKGSAGNKFYAPNLANFPGDPFAFYSDKSEFLKKMQVRKAQDAASVAKMQAKKAKR
jgi:putative FmdB family regulatory protein